MMITENKDLLFVIDGKEYDTEEIVRESEFHRDKYNELLTLSIKICEKYKSCSECPLFTYELNGFCL